MPIYIVVMRGPNPLDAKPIIASEDPTVVASVLKAIKHELPSPDPRELSSAGSDGTRGE